MTATSALHEIVLPGTELEIMPVHLSITQKHSTGTTSSMHLVDNADLGVKDTARTILASTNGVRLVIALDVDEDHDEIHYQRQGGEARPRSSSKASRP